VKFILYIATSLDGYIAQANDDLSFLNMVEQEWQDYVYDDFIKIYFSGDSKLS
jgi:dihydrofolate reductase